MKNILIVEGDSDKFFFDALIRKMNITAELEAQPFCNIDDYECLEGDSLNKLIGALDALKMQARKNDIQRIGIIIDRDTKTEAQRLERINEAIKAVFPKSLAFQKVDTFVDVLIDEHISIPIGCHLLNVDDQCTKKEQKQAGRKCNTEASMQKDIWDFDHVCLNDLKQFLVNFQ